MTIQIGKEISHYRIVETLGFGAMSTIYKAQDTRLDRHVALKFLTANVGIDEEDKERLIQEAKTASALDHPNICTIFEIDETPEGQVFISMAYYPGETLKDLIAKGPFSEKDALRIFSQIAQGLSKAHSKGIVHRDLKPANIIITEDRVVKILDFGIAKILDKASQTLPGTIMGTPGYMPPEQATEDTVDYRSDIWSLGVILFEMLTGELPFKGENYASFIYSITSEEPRELSSIRSSVSDNLQRIIDKTLEKKPENRFQQVDELIQSLNSIEKGQLTKDETIIKQIRPKTIPSIAVLPFMDLSPQGDQEYFCDGLTEDIINTLSRVEGLRVVSRSSTFKFRGKNQDLREVGIQLKVHYIIEGNIRKSGDRIRISIQLTSASDGFLIWSDKLDFKIEDVFDIQDKITRSIVDKLHVELLGQSTQKIFKQYTKNAEAYTNYLDGRFHWNKRTRKELKTAIELFETALNKDPNYALAYSGLADSYIILGLYGMMPPKTVMEKARATVQKALQIDNELAEAHVTLGCLKAVYDWDWTSAESQFKHALDLNQNYAVSHHWFAINLLTPLGRFDEALDEIKKALYLDPISLVINATIGLQYYFANNFDLAIEYYRKTLEKDSDFAIAHFFLGQTLVQKGDYKEAIHQFKTALKLFGGSTNMLANLGYAAALDGKKDIATKVLNKLLDFHSQRQYYVSSYDIACIYYALNETDMVFEWLEKAVDERAYLLIYLKVDPLLKDLKSDSRFTELKKRIRLN